MNQEERLEYLINRMLEEKEEYRGMKMASGDKAQIFRALRNIRMPEPLDQKTLKIQNQYLQEESKKRGSVSLLDIPTIQEQYGSTHEFGDKISIWQGDITRLAVDAVVNAANSQMLGCFVPCHKCIDNAIHSAAGMQLREECSRLMRHKRIQYGESYEEPTGQAEITSSYNLPAKFVIHTVGPIVGSKLNYSHCQDLKNCYRNVLKCAAAHNVHSVAFCCISTGEYHFPNDVAAKIAVDTVTDFLMEGEEKLERIIFNVFKDLDRELYEDYLVSYGEEFPQNLRTLLDNATMKW